MSTGIARANKDLTSDGYLITPSYAKFTIETFPAARLNDVITGTLDKIITASTKFFVNGLGVARLNDKTISGNNISTASTKFFTV